MRISKLHHACVTITDGETSLLVDPGTFAPASVDGMDAVLVTHLHVDHLDPTVIAAALEAGIPVWLPADAAEQFPSSPLLHVAEPGDRFTVGTLTVQVCGDRHAELHPELAGPMNRGYLIGDILITGDAHLEPPGDVRVLVTPIDAPWLRASDLIRYVRRIRPALCLGVHDGLLNHNGRTVASGVAARLAQEGAGASRILADGEILDVG